jgi:DNA-binding Lrp family transcriptional regulator
MQFHWVIWNCNSIGQDYNENRSAAGKVDEVPMLVAPYLSPQRQELCKNHEICFMDLSGNVHLAYRSFYVEKIGCPSKFPEKRQRRSPFSDKASLILRELIKNSARQWGVRELAQKVGLNPGYVSRMAESLKEMGYASRIHGKLQIRASKEILDEWVSAYDLKKNDLHRFFCMAANVEEILQRLRNLQVTPTIKYALSVQAGASLIAPHAVFKEVHAYVADQEGLVYFKKQMELKESDQGSNFVLMLPYYKNSVFYDHHLVDGLPVVSDIQLYLDLYKYPIRGREQAEYLYDKRLKVSFGEQR